MGDIADLTIEGTLCQLCGTYIDGDSPGFPRYCDQCRATVNKLEKDNGTGSKGKGRSKKTVQN